ncbi:hypothetical protein LLB_2480 [Legionella longbeachae D-4968]|nr:hypothetical protein LLB_2480 [Legionella longbeachae D-4968]
MLKIIHNPHIVGIIIYVLNKNLDFLSFSSITTISPSAAFVSLRYSV